MYTTSSLFILPHFYIAVPIDLGAVIRCSFYQWIDRLRSGSMDRGPGYEAWWFALLLGLLHFWVCFIDVRIQCDAFSSSFFPSCPISPTTPLGLAQEHARASYGAVVNIEDHFSPCSIYLYSSSDELRFSSWEGAPRA